MTKSTATLQRATLRMYKTTGTIRELELPQIDVALQPRIFHSLDSRTTEKMLVLLKRERLPISRSHSQKFRRWVELSHLGWFCLAVMGTHQLATVATIDVWMEIRY